MHHGHPNGNERHSRLLRVLNAVGEKLLPGNGSSLLSLDEGALVRKARRETGLEDFGDDALTRRLSILMESLRNDARLNFFGRLCASGDILRLLCSRLELQEARKRHPEIADQEVRRPLFITGLPRTGSTLLHALLAQDPASRVPQVWEVMRPSPAPERASYHSNRRISRASKELKGFDLLVPDFKKAHMMDARLPQECIAITGHTFLSYVFESMFFVSSYRLWHEDVDKTPAYVFHRQFLQHLQWRCPGDFWVLKAPSHLMALEALSGVYPDARIIMTHRDPLRVLASCSSFTEILREPFVDFLDRKALGPEVSWRWEKAARGAIRFRRETDDLQGRFLDVHYVDLMRDTLGMVQRIYDHFDMPLTQEARQAMERFLVRHPQSKNGVHRYRLEDFGLHREDERERFRFYTDRFAVEPESVS